MILTVPAILVFYVYFFGGFYFFFFGLLSLVAGRGVTILAHGAFGPSEKRLIFLIIFFSFAALVHGGGYTVPSTNLSIRCYRSLPTLSEIDSASNYSLITTFFHLASAKLSSHAASICFNVKA